MWNARFEPVTIEQVECMIREMACIPNYVTRTRIGNSEYPNLQVHWVKDNDGLGYTGRCTIWDDGDKKQCDKHIVSVRQSNPLGLISATLDDVWKSTNFEGHTITERDLAWAAAWAVLGIDDKHRRSIMCGPRSKDKG